MAEPRDSSSTTRRRDHYNSQRTSTSRPSTSHTQSRRSYQGYGQPDTFRNLDEAAVSPPVSNREDDDYYTRSSPLEDNVRDGGDWANAPQKRTARPLSRHERNASHRRRGSLGDPYELTEIAAPQPVQRDASGDEQPGSIERQRYLEEEERSGGEESSERSGPYRPRTPAEYTRPQRETRETPKWLTELYTVSYLIFFAIWGTLARLGVQWLTFYPGAPIATPVIWANFAGSFIMGFLAEDQALFRFPPAQLSHENGNLSTGRKPSHAPPEEKAAHSKRKKTIPLYIGLATGLCGSFTSFSSFARDAFLALSNDLPTPLDHPVPNPSAALISTTVPRNGGYGFQAWLHVVLATLALALGGLMTGAHLAIFLGPWTPRLHGTFVQRVVDPVMVLLGWGCWLGALFLAIWPPDRSGRGGETWRGEVLFALVLAPAGCLLRFYASLKLNGLVPAFPLGTFTVNMLGTAVLGMCFDVQHVGVGVTGRVGGGRTGCQVLQGVMDGFCGCLTTVSTWVAEINGLKRKHGWAYAFASIAGGLGLMVVIMGSVRWSVGWQDPVCATGYTGKVHG